MSTDIRDTIRTFAESEPDIIAVYLFGSQASGKAHRFSDVDVAVLLPVDMPAAARFDRRLHLGATLEARLGLPLDFRAQRRAAVLAVPGVQNRRASL